MKLPTYDEWKEFLGLDDPKLEGDDYADELNYLEDWEWGEGVDKRHAIIGGAIVLSSIGERFRAYVASNHGTHAPVIKACLFDDVPSGFIKDFDLREALLSWADYDCIEDMEALRAMCVEVIAIIDANADKETEATAEQPREKWT